MATGSYDAVIQLGVDATKSLSQLATQLQSTGKVLENTLSTSAKAGAKDLKSETSKGISNGMKEGATKGQSFFTSITHQIKNRIQLTIAQGLVDAYRKAFTDIISNVKELNAAQTEFKKVSNLNGQELDAYTDKAAKLGRTVGRTGTEMIQAATEFRKSSYDDKQSIQLARLASMYQNVADGELSAGEAAGFMIAQMKAGFSDVTDDIDGARYAIDAVNEVSNNFAVSSSDLADNIGKTSAAMAAGNVTYAQTLGLMTGMTEVTRNAATSATSLNRIQSRFNQILDESSSVGKKLTTWYSKYGIDVYDKETGQLRSLYDVLGDVNKIWQDLTPNEQKYYLLTQASATQTNRLAALLNNYKDVQDATTAAEEASGSAAKENAKYRESLAYALQNLNSAWEQLSKDLVNSGTLTKIVNFATTIVDLLDKMVNTVGGLPTLFVAVASSIGIVSAALKAISIPGALMSFIGGKALTTAATAGMSGAAKIAGGAAAGAASSGAAGAMGLTGISSIVKTIKEYQALKKEMPDLVAKQAKQMQQIMVLEKASTSQYKQKGQALKEIKEARQMAGVATAAEAKAELKNVKAGNDALSKQIAAFDKMNAVVNMVGGSLVGLAAGVAVIAALNAAGKKFNEEFGFEETSKKVEKYSGKLQQVENKINTLQEKADNGILTDAEQEELAILEAERDVLQDQIDLYERRAKKAVSGHIKGGTGKVDESKAESGFSYMTAIGSLQDARNQLVILQNGKKQIEANLASVEKGSTAWYEYKKQLDGVNENILKQKDVIDEAESKMDSYRAQASKDWRDMRSESSEYYTSMDDKAKAIYDNTHKYAIAAREDISDEIKIASADIIDLLGSNTFGKLLSDSDLSSFETVEDMIDGIQDKMKELDEDTTIKLYARDEAGNILDKVQLQKKDLTEKQWNLILQAQATGDWSKVQEYIDSDDGKKDKNYKKFVNVVAKLDIEGSTNGKSSFFTKDELNPKATVKYKPNVKAIQNMNKKIEGNSINKTVNYIPNTSGLPHATGKRKGEKGGMSWLGDEGSKQNPKPELVVGEDGAYLAGTSGWELHDLKASDTVYTATQTKKLLANNSFYGTPGELPRYAKGKFAKSNSKRAKKSAKKLETWEYQLDIGKISEEEYINKLKNLSKKTKQITKDQYRDMKKEIFNYNQEKEKLLVEEYNTQVSYGLKSYKEVVNYIKKSKKLNSDAKEDLLKQAQEAEAEWLQTQLELGLIDYSGFENGLKALDKVEDKQKIVESGIETMIDAIEDGGGAWGSFEAAGTAALGAIQSAVNSDLLGIGQVVSLLNSYQTSMMNAAKDKYQALLEEEQLKQELMETVANRNIKALQDQMDAIDKENEAQERHNDLLEAEAALANAKAKKLRVWQAGVGWTYKEDVKAVKEAQKELNKLKKDAKKQVLQDAIDEWEEYLETIQDEYAYDLLLSKLGMTNEQVEALTGNSLYLNETFKGNYEQILTNCNAYELELDQIDKTKGKYADLAKMIQELISLYIELMYAKKAAQAIDEAAAALATAKSTASAATSASNAADKKAASTKATANKKGATTKQKNAAKAAATAATKAEQAEQAAIAAQNEAQAKYDSLMGAFVEKYGSEPTEYFAAQNARIDALTGQISGVQLATGTDSAPEGFALVGEKGPELHWMNKGDSVISNAASRNLMALANYTPQDLAKLGNNDSHNVILNVQKGAIVVDGATGDGYAIAQEIVTQLERKATQMSYNRII